MIKIRQKSMDQRTEKKKRENSIKPTAGHFEKLMNLINLEPD